MTLDVGVIGVGMIGVGMIGEDHIRPLTHVLPGARVAAVAGGQVVIPPPPPPGTPLPPRLHGGART